MDNEKRIKTRKYYLTSGTITLIIGLVLLMVISGQKDSWDYYLSSSRRDEVDMGNLLAWLLVLWGGLELGCGLVLFSEQEQNTSSHTTEQKLEEQINWIEGEIVDKEWSPDHHQVEWITMRQKNGVTVRLWHYIADGNVYKVGDCGMVRVKDCLITEFVSSENVF